MLHTPSARVQMFLLRNRSAISKKRVVEMPTNLQNFSISFTGVWSPLRRMIVDRLLPRHAAVADFQRQIVEQPGEAELVPFHPVMNGNEIVVDIGEIIVARARAPCVLAKAMCARHRMARLRIPREIVAEEHRARAARLERIGIRPEIGCEIP